MKIIYGITKSNFGGAQRYVFDLARHAQKQGHDVAVICGLPAQAGGSGILVDKLKNHNIRVLTSPHLQRDISLFDELRAFHFIFRTLYEEKPDVFHTNSSKMGGIGNLAARLVGIKKIIFTGHGWAFKERRPWWQKIIIKFFAWLTVALSHKTICVSEKTRDDILWPFIKGKLIVIRNGIEKFNILPRVQARRELGIDDENKLIVGVLAELHWIKGIDILIEAWKKFSKHCQAKLIILGQGEAREDIEELAEMLGVRETIALKGYVENARQYLAAFDIFVLPSRSENLPYAILEAGLAGLPVIATNVGGIPEIIETGISGTLVDPEEPDTLFSTMLLLAESKDLRKRLGEALKETVLKDFSARKMAEQTIKLYVQVRLA